jgi:hypothetical protein
VGLHGSDLPQYTRQFGRLVEALLNAPCSIVILSGDVHWGRVSSGINLRKKRLIEVISSPLAMSTLRSLAGCVRPWRRALPLFGSAHCEIRTDSNYKLTAPHFASLDFSIRSPTSSIIDMRVKAWPVRKPLLVPAKDLTCTFEL